MPYKDPEKALARAKAYREANREKLRAKQKAYYETNREKVLTWQKAYQKANREKYWCRNAVYTSRQRARARGTPHAIDRKYLESIWTGVCPVLGLPFNLELGSGRGPDSATLDCFDPDKGYVPGNVCIISDRANMVKSNVTDPDIIDRVAHYVRHPHLYVPNWSPDG